MSLSLLIMLGAALGPRGVGVLSEHALSAIDPLIPAALAAFGVLLGQAIGGRDEISRRILLGALSEGALTIVAVSAGMAAAAAWLQITALPVALFAVAVALCAASSSRPPAAERGDAFHITGQTAAIDDVVLVIGGGVLLAVLREQTIAQALLILVQLCVLAAVVALAAWLLLARPVSDTEQRVFTLATVLLLGGAAEYLSLSALLSGLIAGVLWRRVRGATSDVVRRDLDHVRQPLVALVLIVAGARVELSPEIGILAIAYAVLRASGKLAGGWLVGRRTETLSNVGSALVSPGVLGVTFALMLLHVDHAGFSAVLGVAAAGALTSEVISLAIRLRPHEALA